MEQRVSLVTIGVDDVARAKTFYEALGWRGQEVEETVFFQAGGMAVVLWGRAKLAEDAAVDDAVGQRRIDGIALAHNVSTPSEVHEILAAAERAGARVTRPARETFYGGYSGYFTDPDGHLWEIAHNPGFTLNADGTLTLPDFEADRARSPRRKSSAAGQRRSG